MRRHDDTPLMSVTEAAKVLGISGNFIRTQLQAGELSMIGFATRSANDGRWRYCIYKDKVNKLRGGMKDYDV